ncbi:MAG: hypothetical protein AUK47_08395 [Deltaproteobacteria bacterium CG2_30_63_29]|nr:MAG: hypothetical protein AUK47_08395 [Deltaproteobacteria bacterium CG2_30_63_29]PJB41565.1 MAG: glycosyl transferase [Deltaproteobacteria bacterium CG_4_9_14_3_um_filter_63_12]
MTSVALSIVIPAYNEASRLGPTLERVFEWLEAESLDAEVLVVDDGSKDDTAALVRRYCEHFGALRLLQYGANRGKGYAVGHGVVRANGEHVLFSDADLSTPIEEYFTLAAAMGQADVAIGSRAVKGSNLEKRQPLYRELMGRSFNLAVRAAVMGDFHDTQCGFKLFTAAAARQCFARRRLDGFAFDVEILYIARKLGLSIAEVPVHWQHYEASRVDPIKDSARMLADLLRIRWLHL